MTFRNLIPWGRDKSLPVPGNQDPFAALHREMQRMMDEVFAGFTGGDARGWTDAWPRLEVSDTGREIVVRAEVPGLSEKDLDIVIEDGVLVLRGQTADERRDEDKGLSERFYGQFERQIPVGRDVESDKISAALDKGVLTVTLPKTATAASKRIAIRA